MNRMWLIALPLLAPVNCIAAEIESAKKKSDTARKAVVVLASVGLDSPEVLHLVKYVDENTEDGYLKLAEERAMGGTIKLHYELSGGFSKKQVELRFTPDDSNFTYTARPKEAMVNYRLRF